MSFDEAQQDVDQWTSQFDPQYWDPHEMLARLAEEVGELGREVNHAYGPKPKKDGSSFNVEEELVDIMFTVICFANKEGIDLDEAWSTMISQKLEVRDKDRFDDAS